MKCFVERFRKEIVVQRAKQWQKRRAKQCTKQRA